jgi:hypothetical protein
MTSTAAQPGPYDPLVSARPDEPVFTLVGRDVHAPATVLHWVDRARADALKLIDPAQRRAELTKCTDAEMVAADMKRWRKGEPEHDTTTQRRVSTEAAPSGGVSDGISREQAIVAAVAHLREAAYHLSEAQEAWTRLELPVRGLLLGDAVKHINALADDNTPRRTRT